MQVRKKKITWCTILHNTDAQIPLQEGNAGKEKKNNLMHSFT